MFYWYDFIEGNDMIKFTLDKLDDEIGLKFNENIILGKNNVNGFITNHHELFNELNLESIDNSQMLYGYNSLGNPIKLGFNGEKIKRIIVISNSISTNRYKAIISYDGSRYSGFQIQKNQITIQGELSKAISSINNIRTSVHGASRTDAGVHALEYVFHFDAFNKLTPSRWKALLNYQLPKDIYVSSVKSVHPLFHSRYDVYKKEYVYRIRVKEKNPFMIKYEWQIDDINIDVLKQQIEQIIGTHDFLSFCKGQPISSIRTIFNAKVIEEGSLISLVFEGDGFLRYMIRILVYTLVEVSKGHLKMNISEILDEKSRKHTKHLAPASGLYLNKITY